VSGNFEKFKQLTGEAQRTLGIAVHKRRDKDLFICFFAISAVSAVRFFHSFQVRGKKSCSSNAGKVGLVSSTLMP